MTLGDEVYKHDCITTVQRLLFFLVVCVFCLFLATFSLHNISVFLVMNYRVMAYP